jgi:hypothetical protein
MGLRDKLRRLQKPAEGELESFELLDGSRYYFDRLSWELFMHWIECGRAGNARNWPEVVRKLTEAKDVTRALELVEGEGKFSFLVYDPDILITERRLEPRPLVSHYDPEAGKHVPIDPYEWELEHLSG